MTRYEAQWLTTAVLALTFAGLMLYDLVIMSIAGPDASISRVVGQLMHRWPLAALTLTFWLGLFFGHCWLSAW